MILSEIPEHAFVPFDGELGGPLQEAIFPVVAVVNGMMHPVGTAFAIHPNGLLITAAHVIEHAASFGNPDYELHVLYVSAARRVNAQKNNEAPPIFGGLLPIVIASTSQAHDIALCSCSPPRNIETGQPLELRVMNLQALPPKVGEHISAIGYHSMTATPIKDSILYDQKTAISTATVIEKFDLSRDKSAANYPCFHVDARFDPGMSGGPIMGENGSVCGIVSRGMFHDLSLGASIWPAFGLKAHLQSETPTLYELAKRGDINVFSLDALVVDGDRIGIRR